ncbi:hypothetical protein MMC25_005415 [Agyrium rufum]|nr:hypothetical protein [Agyrium rufum]
MAQLRLAHPALFICDIQEKFRPAIFEYPAVIATANKMVKASKILSIPIFATTQKRTSLGETVAELELDNATSRDCVAHIDKTAFSMWIPEIRSAMTPEAVYEVAIVGIETHICVTQTALDLLAHGHKVYVLADGVSSCNKEEIPIALRRLRREGAIVTTSEGFLYECMGDAGIPKFKDVARLVKEYKGTTSASLRALCKI